MANDIALGTMQTPMTERLCAEHADSPQAVAILADTFMLYTHAKVRDVLIERASDWNAFIAKQVDALT